MKLPHVKPRQIYAPGGASRLDTKGWDQQLQIHDSDVEFVELLGRSNFSFLQGASHPEEMALHAQVLGYKGLALCDLNGLYGVVRGFQAIEYPSKFLLHTPQTKDFRFHCGSELLFHALRKDSKPFSLALIPINKDGYYHLCQLITLSKRRAEKGYSHIALDDLKHRKEFLMALALPPWDEKDLEILRDTFGDRIFLPVSKDYTWESLENFKQAQQLEEKLNIPIVATNRPLMHSRERKPLLDILTCILHKTKLETAHTRLTPNAERYLKPLSELKMLWSDRPDALKRTLQISKQIHFSLHELQYEYPQALSEGSNPTEVLRRLTEEGLKLRFPNGVPEKVLKTTHYELALIAELKYEDYFLTLWDVCQFAKSQGILFQGRGSAANSVVCYSIGLTAVNPMKVDLIFERFLSRERGEPPDIDIDFQSDRREEVIQYIYRKYGSEHAAMVCTVICYRSRMALRECAKVLGVSLETINFLIKFMGREGLSRLKADPSLHQRLGLKKRTYELLIQTASALVGFPRHLGIHTGGFLISRRPIAECVPVEKASMDQRYVIQWNKDDLTILKMLKIDVLGLGMLGALNQCFKLLKEVKGIDFDLYSFPPNDEATYAMIQRAETVGVFQIESRAQMSLLPRLKPKEFYDLVVEVAIVRPGPIQGGMIHPYIKRRNKLEKVDYAHEDLKPILEKTYGVPIFQEQIMQMAAKVCGFSPGEADELRRIMSSSWKKSDLMHGLRTRIINGMLAYGIALEYAERIYQTIVGFSSFGFPESHAASFALLTYASCYLKCHFPDIFVCSLLNSQPMGFYSPRTLIGEAQKNGVQFLDVDIQHSDYDYTVPKDRCVRVGLKSIYGLKKTFIEKIISTRQQSGFFKDLSDLCHRVPLDRRSLILLASAGALQSFGHSARQTLWQVQSLKLDPQSLFFAEVDLNHQNLLPQEKDWDELNREYKFKGFSVHTHPMQLCRKEMSKNISKNRAAEYPVVSKNLKSLPNGRRVWIGGLLGLTQKPPTAKGFCFLTMEDEFGIFNVVLKPPIYEKYRLDLIFHSLLKIYGVIEQKSGVINIKAEKIEPLSITS